MTSARRIPGIDRGARVIFEFEGAPVEGFVGESVSAALLAADTANTYTTRGGEGRGYFCGMSTCWECVVEIDRVGAVRGCRTPVAPGLRVRRSAR